MECLIVDDDDVTISVLESLIEKVPFLSIGGSCSSALEASSLLFEKKIDLIFLDVEMPEISGFDFLSSLQSGNIQVILMSHNKDYAYRAFEFNVVDFLGKPVMPERFLKAVTKARSSVKESADDSIFIKHNGRLVKVLLKDIHLVEALSDYIYIHTPSDQYIVYSTLKGIESRLPGEDFVRVHHSYIVRLDKIDAIEDNTLKIGSRLIPISRPKRKELLSRLRLL